MPVGVEQRFSAAQEELNTRLTNRQTVVTTYTGVAVPLICAAVVMSSSNPGLSAWLGLSLPPVALSFALLYAHNDLTIGLLSAFLRECENFESDSKIPAWHSREQGWMSKALVYRRLSDFAFTATIAASAVPTFVNLPGGQLGGVGLVLGVIFTLAALAVVLASNGQRKDLKNWQLRKEDGALRLRKD